MRIFRIVEETNGLGNKLWKVEEKDVRFNFWPFTKLGTWEVSETRSHIGYKMYCMRIESFDAAKAIYDRRIAEYKQQTLLMTKKITIVAQQEV